MNRLHKLNEGEYKFILTETLHYPKFLDNIKNEIFNIVFQNVIDLVHSKQSNKEIVYKMKDSDLFDDITIQISIYENDITLLKNYTPSFYYNVDKMTNNKIINPLLILKIPVEYNNHQITNASALKTILTHEIGHLYDDWISQMQGNEPFSLSSKNKEISELINMGNNTQNELIKSIGHLAYLSNETEKHSFISQIFNELELLKCNKLNWREKYPQLTSYKNYHKLYLQLKNAVNNSNIEQLFYLNNLILYSYKNTNVPRMQINKFDSFKYKEKLLNFVEELFNDFIHRLGGIMSYYLSQQAIVPNGLPQNQFL